MKQCFFAWMFLVGLLAPAASPVFASTLTTFDFPGGRTTIAVGINQRGQIVGVYFTGPSDIAHGFLLDRGSLTTIDVPGISSLQVIGINNRGQTVGTWGGHGFVLD